LNQNQKFKLRKNIKRDMKETMFVFHLLGLILSMGAGLVSFFLKPAIKKLEPEERVKFVLKLRILGKMGVVGLTFLVLSGGYLMTPYWKVLSERPAIIAKLSLVLVLIVLTIIMDLKWKGALKNNGGPDLMALPKLGMIALPVGIMILILAVISFH
jgi:hypothetical protein